MNRLHKKVVSLEAEIVGACELKQGMESEFARNRKLLKLVEKYKRDLTEAQLEIQDLKTNLIYARETEVCILFSSNLVYSGMAFDFRSTSLGHH